MLVKYRRLLKSPVDKPDSDLVLPAQAPAPDLRAHFKKNQSRFGPVTPVQTAQNINRLPTMYDNWDKVDDEEALSQEQERRAAESQSTAGAARPLMSSESVNATLKGFSCQKRATHTRFRQGR